MADFLLVHGAWHGAWCWDKVIPALEALGHSATAIDLPGHGADTTPPAAVTLRSYVERIGAALNELPHSTILVGHSMGGIAISAAAEAFAGRIGALVYVAAFLPRSGESLLAIEERNPKPAVPLALVPAENEPSATLRDDAIVSLFYHDCSEADRARAKELLTKQPLVPFSEKLSLTERNFGSVPRYYVECTDDRAINIALQRDMVAASGVERVMTMDASHSPFLSRPAELASHLAGVT